MVHVMMVQKMKCDICRKSYESLGSYSDEKGPGYNGRWWMCNKCFEKADELAAKNDRWPDARDFKKVRGKMRGSNPK